MTLDAQIDRIRTIWLSRCEAIIARTVRDFIGEGCPESAEDILTVLEARGFEGIRLDRHLEGKPDVFVIRQKASRWKVVEVELPDAVPRPSPLRPEYPAYGYRMP